MTKSTQFIIFVCFQFLAEVFLFFSWRRKSTYVQTQVKAKVTWESYSARLLNSFSPKTLNNGKDKIKISTI